MSKVNYDHYMLLHKIVDYEATIVGLSRKYRLCFSCPSLFFLFPVLKKELEGKSDTVVYVICGVLMKKGLV